MLTKKKAIDEMLHILDTAVINGKAAASAHTADYKQRAGYALNGIVQLLAEYFKIPASHTVVQTPVQNLLGNNFGVETILPGKPYRFTVTDMRSFYLEMMGEVEIRITCGGSEVMSLKGVYGDSEYRPISRNIPEGYSGKFEIECSSQYPASVRYVAAYGVPFHYDHEVQPNTPYAAYEMPCNFREYDKCVKSSDGSTYEEFRDVHREGFRTYLLPRFEKGQFTFHYWRNPCTVPEDAKDDFVLEVAAEAESLVALKLAADLTRTVPDDQSIAYWLDAEFSSRLNSLERVGRGGIQCVQSVYSV